MKISFGGSEREQLQIEIMGYERQQPVREFYDDNWLKVRISVSAGGFRGEADASFLTEELVSFLTQLRPLYTSLRGQAEFQTMENQLRLILVGDSKGHIGIDGVFLDDAGVGNGLTFKINFDQSQLGQSMRELEQAITKFPVRKT
jgi:hypothetical protein